MSRSTHARIAIAVRVTRTNVFGRRYGDPSMLEPDGALDALEQTPWLSFVHDPAIERVVGLTARRDERLDLADPTLAALDEITFDVPASGLFDVGVREILETVLTDGVDAELSSEMTRLPSELTDEVGRESAFQALASGSFSAGAHAFAGAWLVDHGELGSGIAHLRAGQAMSPGDPWIAEDLASACREIGDLETARSAWVSSRTPQNDPWRVREWSLRGDAD